MASSPWLTILRHQQRQTILIRSSNNIASRQKVKQNGIYHARSPFSTAAIDTVVDSSSLVPWWEPYRMTYQTKIDSLPETKSVQSLQDFLRNNGNGGSITSDATVTKNIKQYKHILKKEDYLTSLEAAMAVFSLHIHSRIAAMVGHGYYTIGPCGEELLASAGICLEEEDSSALHYRHTAISVVRQLQAQQQSQSFADNSKTTNLQDILLARARGYTVSRHDPVTGGVHCSIGGSPNEYIVTSTLSSQCPSAVGRALGYSLVKQQLQQQSPENHDSNKPISFVTIGDGSLHNHHFLSSFTLARHAKHLGIKCPLVMGISNNGLSISYETKNYIGTVFGDTSDDPLIPVFRANGQDMLSVYDQTKQATEYARKHQSPCVLLYDNVIRRFGHAATDRQFAYLSNERIDTMADTCVLQNAMHQAVDVMGYTSYPELLERWKDIHYNMANQSFAQAISEPKVTLDDMMERVVPPLAPVIVDDNDAKYKPLYQILEKKSPDEDRVYPAKKPQNEIVGEIEKPQVLRKHMTRVFQEVMEEDPSLIYLGEDVRHGGYYLVTEGLADQFPNRVLDFPPDETTLLGAGLGFAQLGLVPIVEIPYAKYLDCGVDLFYEIAIQHWLSGGSGSVCDDHKSSTNSAKQQKGGMVIRLQGFDRGVFGGNFHTHNSLAHIPPGVDVVCYSNGVDYAKGMRYAVHQAKSAGRIVMVVDCTHLLNLRHVFDKDRKWEFPYPVMAGDGDDFLEFDSVRRYALAEGRGSVAGSINNIDTTATSTSKASTAIVSYGNGIVTSLQARQQLVDRGVLNSASQLDVIDCPYLSDVPTSLETILKDYDKVVFADLCKEGPGSNIFSSMITSLQQKNALPSDWLFVGAPRTYNPLGSTVTFLNSSTIEEAVAKIVRGKQKKAKHNGGIKFT